MTQTMPKLTINCYLDKQHLFSEHELEQKLLPYVNSVNISCGFHSDSPEDIANAIQLAIEHKLSIGALISYQDLPGYGERHILYSKSEMIHSIVYQIGALTNLAHLYDAKLAYIKPHGALFRDMMSDLKVFDCVAKAVMETGLPLVILSKADNSPYLEIADNYNVPLLFEVCADRIYRFDGKLTPRENIKYHQTLDDIFYQAMQLANFGTVTTEKRQPLALDADTLSFEVNSQDRLQLLQRIYKALNQ